jgi:hypothetical protein
VDNDQPNSVKLGEFCKKYKQNVKGMQCKTRPEKLGRRPRRKDAENTESFVVFPTCFLACDTIAKEPTR